MLKKLFKWFLKNPDEIEEKKEEEKKEDLDKMIDELSNHYACNPDVTNSDDCDMEDSEKDPDVLDELEEEDEEDEEGIPFRMLCKEQLTIKIDNFYPKDGLFAQYSVYESMSKFFENHGVKDYKINIENPVFLTANRLKSQIKHKDKHGVFDVITKLARTDGYPETEFGIIASMSVPVYPFSKTEEADVDNWLVIELSSSIDVSYSSEDNNSISNDELTKFFVEVCKAVIKTAAESNVAKDLQYKLPNVMPENIMDLPFKKSEREVVISSRYTGIDESVCKTIQSNSRRKIKWQNHLSK